MSGLESYGQDPSSERGLFVLELARGERLPPGIELGSPHFVCLIAWDSRGVTVKEISSLVDGLLTMGCAYFCTWGPGCERVHDIVDESVVELELSIITTWHSDEPLEDALWFLLNTCYPVDVFGGSCKAGLAIAIGEPSWATTIEGVFKNPRAFSEAWLDKNGGQ